MERPWKTSDARLVLEDGSIWRAKSFGATGTQVGEVVFNTSLTGYFILYSLFLSMLLGTSLILVTFTFFTCRSESSSTIIITTESILYP